jgi:predicted nicotinamide N-methyase
MHVAPGRGEDATAAPVILDAEAVERKLQRHLSIVSPLGNVVTLAQDFMLSDTGGALWDSAVVLAECLVAQGSLRGQKVLELGSGVGYTALCARALGAHVFATDGDAVVLDVLRRNCSADSEIIVLPLRWGVDDASRVQSAHGPFDLVLAADVVYDRTVHAALLETFASLSPRRFMLAVRKRDSDSEKEFLQALQVQMHLQSVMRADQMRSSVALSRKGLKVYLFEKRVQDV